jgi:LysR family glycine cleavage system transcriptional activator
MPVKATRRNDMATDPGLSWSQLRAFEACARLTSFNAAAAQLNLGAAAIRHQIGLLEGRLGVRRFERQAGRLALTAAGATLERQIARPMRELVSACAIVRNAALEAPITLTVPPLFARQFLFGDRFLEWCDDNAVRLDVTDAKRDLFAIDPVIAVRLGAEPDPALTLMPVLSVRLVLAAKPSVVAKSRPRDAAWWETQNLLSPNVSERLWDQVWPMLGVGRPAAIRRRRFSSYAAALDAACAGHGVMLAALPFAETEFQAGRLARLSNIQLSSPIGYSIVMRSELARTRRGRLLRQRLLKEVAR